MSGMPRPLPRGPLSRAVLHLLAAPPPSPGHRGPAGPTEPAELTEPAGLTELAELAEVAVGSAGPAVLSDDDVQLSLTVLYELHYRGLDGVDDRWEWAPELLAARAVLERALEDALRTAVADRLADAPRVPGEIAAALFAMAERDDGPSLSRHLARTATLAQFREFLIHRSLYHLKEADPHTWAIPRLSGHAKAALLEVQADEYGGGRFERMHATLFATAMRGTGLDDRYSAYLDALPAVTLAWANTFSWCGLHRRLRGATVGHLAALEMTSSVPNRRYARAVRRLCLPDEVAWFFDEHVEADAVHEQIAAHDLAGRLVEAEPELYDDVLFGAAVALQTDALVAEHLLRSWAEDRSSLRAEVTHRPAGARYRGDHVA